MVTVPGLGSTQVWDPHKVMDLKRLRVGRSFDLQKLRPKTSSGSTEGQGYGQFGYGQFKIQGLQKLICCRSFESAEVLKKRNAMQRAVLRERSSEKF